MFRFGHYFVGFVLIVLCAGFALHWIMGEDFGPWVSSAKMSVREQFVKLVDDYSLELEKAKTAVAEAEERALKLRMQKQMAAVRMKTLDRELTVARSDIGEAKTQLATLQGKLSMGQTVRLVSGRVANDDELRTFVDNYSSRIEIAQEKVGYLEQIAQRRGARYEKLVRLDQESPNAIRRLRNSVDFLSRKVEMYREIKDMIDEDAMAEVELNGLYAKAQQTLEDAHAKLDMKLAEVDAMLGMSLELEIEPVIEPHSTDRLLADIRTTLASVQVER
jgi:chromosome segregation ATPase